MPAAGAVFGSRRWWVDAREHRLPDPLLAAAAVGVFTALGVAAAGGRGWSPWWQAVAVAGGVFVLMYVVAMFSGTGYGDVKLCAVIAGCAGFGSPVAALAVLTAGFAAAALAGAAAAVRRPPASADRPRALAADRGRCGLTGRSDMNRLADLDLFGW